MSSLVLFLACGVAIVATKDNSHTQKQVLRLNADAKLAMRCNLHFIEAFLVLSNQSF